jgi:hypothetical protein
MIVCEDIFKCEDIRELRRLCREYYIDNLADTEVYNEEIGIVKFSKGGYKKPLSLSADVRKLRIFPYLGEIVRTSTLSKIENDRYERLNTEWFCLKNNITLDGTVIDIMVNIRKDCNGNLYYDHAVFNE